MAVATVVTFPEIHAVLAPQGFVEVQIPGTKERVYSRFVDRDAGICQRVYTSVVGDSSRGVGEDAIRVVLVTKLKNGEVKFVGADRRVHRVAGWRENLQERINAWRDQIGPKCTACGCPTVLKKTKRPFWGCCRYPLCRTFQDVVRSAPVERKVAVPAVVSNDPPPSEWGPADEDFAMKHAYQAAEIAAERAAYMREIEDELAANGIYDGD